MKWLKNSLVGVDQELLTNFIGCSTTEEVKIYNKQIHRRSSDIQQTNTQKKFRYTTNKYTEEVKIVIYNKQIHRRS